MAIAHLGCGDAVPGSTGGGGGASTGGGGDNNGQGGAATTGSGGAPNFAQAEVVQLYSPADAVSFAEAVAIDGDTILLSGHAPNASSGEAHVFVFAGDAWSHQATLTSQLAQDGDFFGSAVAISGDRACLGADGYGTPLEANGVAFLLGRNGQSWVSQKSIPPPSPVDDARFGHAVALSGSTALVGAPFLLGSSNAGNAYVVVEDGDELRPVELVPDEPTMQFGEALAIDGDTAVVAAPSSDGVYVFVRNGRGWAQQAKLVPGTGVANMAYGAAVAISGDTVVVGSRRFEGVGAAYVFVREGTTWTQQAELRSEVPKEGDGFGRAVAIDGNAIVVGALFDDDLGAAAGAAFVFAREGATWTQQTQLLRPNGGEEEEFGISVAIDGQVVVVGTEGFQHQSNPNSAVVFRAP